MALLYQNTDWNRDVVETASSNDWRSDVSRDYGRVIHSSCFRRLQGKTQVFPCNESDFFRNRLTHSLEVSQIAQGIAERLNHEYRELHRDRIIEQLCAVAALVHDLGHPPFGHNGERALDEKMISHGGFEGNAQTIRILAKVEKKVLHGSADGDNRAGLNLTYRTLASCLKYDSEIPLERSTNDGIHKGYYHSESGLVSRIKEAVLGGVTVPKEFKTLECSIMDIADDIAYSTYDLEDALKAGFLTPLSILSSDDSLLEKVSQGVSKKVGRTVKPADVLAIFAGIFGNLTKVESGDGDLLKLVTGFKSSQNIANSSHLRTKLSSQLVNRFINSVELHYNSEQPVLSRVSLKEPARTTVEVLKQYVYNATIFSSRVKLGEFRGTDVVAGIFDALAGRKGELLMPDDVRSLFERSSKYHGRRIICDYVAGMTDRYAIEFYGRLHSDDAQSMFKPI